MMDRFAGKIAWITGASSGIGAALAAELDARGAHLILSGRREDALAAVAATLARPCLVLPFDTTDAAALPNVVDAAVAWRGGIDLLVNNAGISQRSLAIDTDLAVYRTIMEVDFFAPVQLTQRVLPHMVARGGGHIAVTSSVAGKVGAPLRSGYSAAKHALLGWFDAVRAEVETAYGIAVSVILPGSVRTDIAVNALSATGGIRGRSDANIANGMPAEQAARQIADALADKTREIVVAEGQEAQALHLRRHDPDTLFALLAEEGRRLAAARSAGGADWQPDPTQIR